MSSDDRRQRGSSFAVIMATVFVALLPVAYVLLSGPAEWLFRHGYLTNVLPWIYKPLIALEASGTPPGEWIKWYWSLWK